MIGKCLLVLTRGWKQLSLVDLINGSDGNSRNVTNARHLKKPRECKSYSVVTNMRALVWIY